MNNTDTIPGENAIAVTNGGSASVTTYLHVKSPFEIYSVYIVVALVVALALALGYKFLFKKHRHHQHQ
jgi:hypothetical protein